ncbi:prepilin peptidase [Bordetella pseudohinzii]|uniref:prepilin peptidase n=1 Tax=Bordetella pseudohinzii TaxID=1331258 RepID=UPI001E2DDFA7|nr:A24 family peptidase [Bordetella pseudohinzii]
MLLGLIANAVVRQVPRWLRHQYADADAIAVSTSGLRDTLVVSLVSILVLAAYSLHGQTVEFVALAVLLTVLVALAYIDDQTRLLPDVLTIPLMWAGLAVNSFDLFTSPAAAIQGAAVGYCSLWGLAKVHQAVTGQLGMEYGDYKLTAALGAWFGLGALYPVLIVAVALGLVSAAYRGVVRGRLRMPFAFGPCLACAGVAYALLPPHWRFW